jgi:hypothetical protein
MRKGRRISLAPQQQFKCRRSGTCSKFKHYKMPTALELGRAEAESETNDEREASHERWK